MRQRYLTPISNSLHEYDPQKAKALLDSAGWILPADKTIREKAGEPLRIELAFIATDALNKSMAEVIQANLQQIGVDTRLIGEEESSFMPVNEMADLA